jgi:hypothetical protein
MPCRFNGLRRLCGSAQIVALSTSAVGTALVLVVLGFG